MHFKIKQVATIYFKYLAYNWLQIQIVLNHMIKIEYDFEQ